MRGCLRIMLRILGSVSMIGSMFCFWSWYQNLGDMSAADGQGDHKLAALFADNATEAFQAGSVFGGMTLALWIGSFLVRRRSTASQPRLVRCPSCNATVSQQEVSDGWCEGCGKRLPFSMRPMA
jgi:hypothetical protein